METSKNTNPFLTKWWPAGMELADSGLCSPPVIDMRYCANRYRTFEGWPKHLLPQPTNLARAGFCYTGRGDTVECYECKVRLNDWQPYDRPFSEHYKWAKDCPFLKTCYMPDSAEQNDICGRLK